MNIKICLEDNYKDIGGKKIMTMMYSSPPEPWETWAWSDNASRRGQKQKKRTDKTAKTMRTIFNKKINDEESSKILSCSLQEWYVLVSHYHGSRYTELTGDYITYFVYEVMGNDDDKVNEWLIKQRQSFKYAPLFEKLFAGAKKIPKRQMVTLQAANSIRTIANTLKITEKEYVRLLVEYLGNPPFLVEDYESIDWEDD